jgi:hypothetical protein
LRETFFPAESGDLILVRLRLTAKRNGHPTARSSRYQVPFIAFFSAETVDLMLVRLRLTAKRNNRLTARCCRNPVPLFAFFFASLRLCVRLSSLLKVAI